MPSLISPLLEAAVTAQFLCFSAFLVFGARSRSAAGYFLAAFTGLAGAMMAVNLAGGGAVLGWRNDVNLFFELLLCPSVFLYVRHVQAPDRPLRRNDCIHVVPALAGLALWRSRALGEMDAYVVAAWIVYLGAAWWSFASPSATMSPAPLRRSLFALLSLLSVVAILRAALALGGVSEFGGSPPYAAMLTFLLITSSTLLMTALRRPDLLIGPAMRMKYAKSGATTAALDALERSLDRLFTDEKPFVQPDLSLEALAARLSAPPRHVSQLVNSRFGMSFPAFINARRADEAARLLRENSSAAIKSVMYDSGFRSKGPFNREFLRRFGVSPSDYRAQIESGGKIN